MNASELLKHLREMKVELTLQEDRLIIEGDEQALDDSALLKLLRENKKVLIEFLKKEKGNYSQDSFIEVPPNLIPAKCDAIRPEMLSLVELSEEEIGQIVSNVAAGAEQIQDIYPLLPFQQGMLFHHLLGEQGDPYLLTMLLSIDHRESVDSYLKALQCVID